MIHVYNFVIFPYLDLAIYIMSNELQVGRAKPAGLSSVRYVWSLDNNFAS
jgi:hypothetical protein